MIRSFITPQSTDIHISVPDNYVGKKVEVLVFACNEPDNVPQDNTSVMADFWGIISKETTEEMHRHITQSREEWEIVA